MKAHLFFRDRDADLQQPLPWNEKALTEDLALDILFSAMAQGDHFVFEVVRKTVLAGLNNDVATIEYRQQILQDCLQHSAIIRQLYGLAVEALEKEKKSFFFGMHYPDSVLHRSVEVLGILLSAARKLRDIADSYVDQFLSEGWKNFFTTLQKELSDEYFACVQRHLEQLKFRDGVLLSTKLDKGNKGGSYTLHAHDLPRRRSWDRIASLVRNRLERIVPENWSNGLFGQQPQFFEYQLHPRDEAGVKALDVLRGRGMALVANALGQSTDHVHNFFDMLRTELAFYVGCLNLHEQLTRKGQPSCFPSAVGQHAFSARGLYDVCLALSTEKHVVGNDADAEKQGLVIITGANQGGKSTFLRSVGLGQLMMQCGMYVPAESFSSDVYSGLFTHYKREEDASMKSGKLDEELSRMSEIVNHVTSNSMILFNESFAATNEREGSEIARQIISALLEKNVKIVCVTHLYELAHGFYKRMKDNVLFMRAERDDEGARTFKLVEGEPLQTSFGGDLYASIFGTDAVRSQNPTDNSERGGIMKTKTGDLHSEHF